MTDALLTPGALLLTVLLAVGGALFAFAVLPTGVRWRRARGRGSLSPPSGVVRRGRG